MPIYLYSSYGKKRVVDGNCWRGRQLKTPRRSISNRTPIFKRMLQNRVDPFGNLIATPYRGDWMGNRGLLHDERQTITRQFRLKAWLICVLQFKDRKRKVMSPGLYTELFFLDEATAFAAGHRPCGECRYEDYRRFCAIWQTLHPGQIGADAMDVQLHAERVDPETREQRRHQVAWRDLPDGAFVLVDDRPWLVLGDEIVE